MSKFPAGDERGSLRFIVLLIILSMAALYVGFQLGNTFFAWQTSPEEEIEVEEAPMAAEEEPPEDVPDEQIEPEEEITEEDYLEEPEEQPEEPEEQPVEAEEEPEEIEDVQDDDPQTDDMEEEEIDRDADFLVQAGAFGQEENAEAFAAELNEMNYPAFISGSEPYQVKVVGGDTREQAEDVADNLREDGYEVFVHSQ